MRKSNKRILNWALISIILITATVAISFVYSMDLRLIIFAILVMFYLNLGTTWSTYCPKEDGNPEYHVDDKDWIEYVNRRYKENWDQFTDSYFEDEFIDDWMREDKSLRNYIVYYQEIFSVGHLLSSEEILAEDTYEAALALRERKEAENKYVNILRVEMVPPSKTERENK